MFTEPSGSELIVGKQPNLVGQPFEEFIAQEYWHENQLAEEANVIWIKQKGLWHHLCFDEDIVFWRSVDKGPTYQKPKKDDIWDFPLRDLNEVYGLADQNLREIQHKVIEAKASIEFKFSNGFALKVTSENDTTKIET